jgi:hypothetical protein
MAKIRISQIESHLGAIQKIIDDCRADAAAEKAAAGEDNAGNVGEAKEIEKRDQPGAQDSAPSGARALNQIEGYSRIFRR